ncbi:MAG: hypothetical protein ACNI27_08460 [Desulfovibrio sp.]
MEVNYKGQVRAIVHQFEATPHQIERANYHAVNKVTRWAKTILKRQIAQSSELPVKLIQGRILHFKFGGALVKLWVGGEPIPVSRLNPKQQKMGVKAGKLFFPGAFVAMKNVFQRSSDSRLPIEKVMYEYHDDVVVAMMEKLQPRLERKFFDTFERELKWQTRTK